MMRKTQEFWGSGAAKLEFLGKPFDASAFKADEGYDDYLLYVGRLSDEKGVDILLKAMQLVPEARLKIAGDGPYRKVLEDMAEKLNLRNVTFLGSTWGEETGKLMSRCRFVVIPSLWYENFPYVMTETFARGKAVVGSDKGGIPEYISEGDTGMVYPSEDHQKLAACIRELWNNPEKAVRMGKNAREMAITEFRDEVFYRRLSDIYQKVAVSLPEKSQI
jgi:glycosyltransferase involved in cell wall biosynthesis